MTYSYDQLRFERYHMWNFIIGVQYVHVASHGYDYPDLLELLANDMGGEFKKPVVLLSVAEVRRNDMDRFRGLDIFDYEYGV